MAACRAGFLTDSWRVRTEDRGGRTASCRANFGAVREGNGMRGIALTAALMAAAQALALAGATPALAQTGIPSLSGQLPPPSLEPSIKPLPPPPEVQEQQVMPAAPSAAPSAPPAATPETGPPATDQPPLAQDS